MQMEGLPESSAHRFFFVFSTPFEVLLPQDIQPPIPSTGCAQKSDGGRGDKMGMGRESSPRPHKPNVTPSACDWAVTVSAALTETDEIHRSVPQCFHRRADTRCCPPSSSPVRPSSLSLEELVLVPIRSRGSSTINSTNLSFYG